METNYLAAIALLLAVCSALAAYALLLRADLQFERAAKVWWRDAFANEAQRHAKTRDELDIFRMTRRRA